MAITIEANTAYHVELMMLECIGEEDVHVVVPRVSTDDGPGVWRVICQRGRVGEISQTISSEGGRVISVEKWRK